MGIEFEVEEGPLADRQSHARPHLRRHIASSIRVSPHNFVRPMLQIRIVQDYIPKAAGWREIMHSEGKRFLSLIPAHNCVRTADPNRTRVYPHRTIRAEVGGLTGMLLVGKSVENSDVVGNSDVW